MRKARFLTRLHDCRRWATLTTMRGFMALSRRVGPEGAMAMGWAAGQLAGLALPIHDRLATNLKQAGLESNGVQRQRYFRRFGCWVGWSLAIYHHGFEASGVPQRISFDASVAYLDQAMALGRGVVLACPHEFCHEIGGAAVNRRYPVVALVRESKNPVRDAIKRRWYQATGVEVLPRPRESSVLSDTLAYIRILRSGKILGITPDVLLPPGKGIAVRVLGRDAVLSPGMIVLAMRARAPLVSCWYDWTDQGSGHSKGRVTIRFDKPIEYPSTGDREETVRDGLQAWCRRLEAELEAHPEKWMFWLDKRWTRVLRAPAS